MERKFIVRRNDGMMLHPHGVCPEFAFSPILFKEQELKDYLALLNTNRHDLLDECVIIPVEVVEIDIMSPHNFLNINTNDAEFVV